MSENRVGRQTPTNSFIIPYKKSLGKQAIDLYNQSKRKAMEWQEIQMMDIMAINDDGQWLHMKYGYSIPRRNGKSEILIMRELWGLIYGKERIMHTAHRTTTSTASYEKLKKALDQIGYTEVKRPVKGKAYEKSYTAKSQQGLETVRILDKNVYDPQNDEDGGIIYFRTRSGKGGLGEGFDLLIIDEAQDYTEEQESALQYTVTSSSNPQTIMCGTPPTAVSAGTVSQALREECLTGEAESSGWAEWSVSDMSDVNDRDIWYETNPSLGLTLKERSVASENKKNEIDFNIQRFGLWLSYNQKSEISESEWDNLQVKELPEFKGSLFVGIKYGHDGKNVAMSIAVKTKEKKPRIFIETIGCKPIKRGNDWIVDFIKNSFVRKVTIDGQNGQQLLIDELKDADVDVEVITPTVKEIINANATFQKSLFDCSICHNGQPSLKQSASNCVKRAIGSNGGFGYKSAKEGIEISILESAIFALWQCSKKKKKVADQRIFY